MGHTTVRAVSQELNAVWLKGYETRVRKWTLNNHVTAWVHTIHDNSNINQHCIIIMSSYLFLPLPRRLALVLPTVQPPVHKITQKVMYRFSQNFQKNVGVFTENGFIWITCVSGFGRGVHSECLELIMSNGIFLSFLFYFVYFWGVVFNNDFLFAG